MSPSEISVPRLCSRFRPDLSSVPSALLSADLLSFMAKTLNEKEEAIRQMEADLECAVCLEVATGQIFSCERQHMVCARCRPRLACCPQCRRPYPFTPIRHRYAENNLASLQKLRKEKEELERDFRGRL